MKIKKWALRTACGFLGESPRGDRFVPCFVANPTDWRVLKFDTAEDAKAKAADLKFEVIPTLVEFDFPGEAR